MPVGLTGFSTPGFSTPRFSSPAAFKPTARFAGGSLPGGFGAAADSDVGGALGEATGQAISGYEDMRRFLQPIIANQQLEWARLGIDNQRARSEHDFRMRGIGLDAQNAQRQHDLAMRMLGIDRRGIGLDRERNALDRADINTDRAFNARARDFAVRDWNQRVGDAFAQGVYQTQQNNSRFLAGGGWFAPGRQHENAEIRRQTQLAGDRATLDFQRELSGLDRSNAKLNTAEERTRIADRELDLVAERLGVKAEELRADLDHKIAQLGLSGQISTSNLMYALSAGNLAQQQAALAFFSQLLSMPGAASMFAQMHNHASGGRRFG